MPNIHILWATLRPEVFKNSHTEWIKRAINKENIKTYVAVNWKEHADMLRDYLKNDYLITLNTNKIGVCYPSHQLSSNLGVKMGQCEDDDIVVFASDDFLPPPNWDTYLINKLKDRNGALLVKDGYQDIDFSNMAEPVFSIPIMTFSCLLKLNRIIYHPIYNHLCSDAELFLNLKELDMIIDERTLDDVIFEHNHWANQKRNPDANDQSYYNNFESDKKTWSDRKKLPLQERLKVN